MITPKYILLTIDVEDWFQVENFKPWIPFETWDRRELRVEKNVHLLLDLFDSVEVGEELESQEAGNPESIAGPGKQKTTHNSQLTTNKSHAAAPSSNTQQTKNIAKQPTNKTEHPTTNTQLTTHSKNNIQTKKVKATFFVLAWIAKKLPQLVREIQSRGHEIASHGFNHQLPEQLSADSLKQDLTDSKKLLEDIIGAEVVGYRAPSFSINDNILKIIQDSGYRYDSSYNSFGLHGRYGRISLNGTGKLGIAHKISQNFYELPISNLRLAGQTLPWGGGAYFRLIAMPIFNLGIKSILQKVGAYQFYAHPWEFDPEQPRVREDSINNKFRNYTNLNKTQAKLRSLIESFNHCQFMTCSEYLNTPPCFGLTKVRIDNKF